MKRLIPSVVFGLALLLLPGLAWAQQGTVTGTVTEAETGDPLPGATVQIPEEEAGAATDTEGRYRITGVPAGEQTVRVTFVGYQASERTVNVPAGGTVRANFQLQTREEELEEVVVTGYRSEQQIEAEGATTTIQATDIAKVDAQSPESALQGTLPGVRVTSQSGQPGGAINVNIRGTGSITAGSDPLFIVDGVQISRSGLFSAASGNPLAQISPNDIENIQVLRGAAAASIYGSQAANGVVLIETKSGSAGDTRISFGARLGRQERIKDIDVMSTEEWANWNGAAYANSANAVFGTDFSPEEGRDIAFRDGDPSNCPAGIGQVICNDFSFLFLDLGNDTLNTDWPGAVYQQPTLQTYDLSISGGNASTQFYVSGTYTNDGGQIIDSEFRSGGVTAKVDHTARDWLSASAKVNVSTQNVKGTIDGGPFINSPFWSSFFAPPNEPIFNEPGNRESGFNGTPNFVFSFNPVQQEEFNDRISNQTQILSNVALNWTFGGGFAGRTYAGAQFQDTKEKVFDDPRLPSQTAEQFVANDRQTDWNVSQTFTFDRAFDDVHDVSGLVGGEYKNQKEVQADASGQDFPNFLFRTLRTAATPTNADFFFTEFRTLSFFSKGDYVYDDRYKIGGTLRVDGSSRFGEDNRYGLFGTVQGFWRISEEAFLEDADFLSNLKLRASYGTIGNNDIGNFAARQLFGAGPGGNPNSGADGGGTYNGRAGIAPTQLGNSALTWEEKTEINIGLDFSAFSNRVTGAVDVFRSDFESLLLNRDLPLDSGFGSAIDNVGETRTEGLEIQLSTVNLDLSGFRWETDFNITFLDQEVRSVLPDQAEIDVSAGFNGVYREGTAPDRWELDEWAGVNPANGIPLYYDRNGNLTYQADTEDQKLFGNTEADFYGGLSNTFSIGGFSAEVFFQYDYGRETFANDAYFLETNTFSYANRSSRILGNFWEEPGDVVDSPEPRNFVFNNFTSEGFSGAAFSSTRWYEDASYIRLKRVRLDYSLPSSLIDQIGIGGQLRAFNVYVQGRNLVTWSEFTGFDPEVVGTALGTYPQGRTFTAGVDLTF